MISLINLLRPIGMTNIRDLLHLVGRLLVLGLHETSLFASFRQWPIGFLLFQILHNFLRHDSFETEGPAKDLSKMAAKVKYTTKFAHVFMKKLDAQAYSKTLNLLQVPQA